MRDFFIEWLERLVNVIVVLMSIGVVIATIAAAFSPQGFGMMGGQMGGGGIGAALIVLILGAVYVLLFGGFAYLGLGIYQNTRRTADAVEKLVAKG